MLQFPSSVAQLLVAYYKTAERIIALSVSFWVE